jgi:hypothetical protein
MPDNNGNNNINTSGSKQDITVALLLGGQDAQYRLKGWSYARTDDGGGHGVAMAKFLFKITP